MRSIISKVNLLIGAGCLSAFSTAHGAQNSFAEIIQVWDNGGRVSIDVYQTTNGRNFSPYSGGGYTLGGSTALAFLAGDFSGDSRTDVIQVWNNGGRVSIEGYRWNTSTRRFDYAVGGGIKYGGSVALKFLSGDVNGDGYADVVQVWDNGGYVSIEGYTFNPGNGRFEYTIGGGAKFGPVYESSNDFFMGDVNGDGKSDIIHLRSERNSISSDSRFGRALRIYQSTGNGFTNSSGNNTNFDRIDAGSNYYIVGHLNKDGRADLLHLVKNGTNAYYRAYTSDGTTLVSNSSSFFPVNPSVITWQNIFRLDDVDGDGDSDLIGGHSVDGRLTIDVMPNFYGESGSTSYWRSDKIGGYTFLQLLTGNVD